MNEVWFATDGYERISPFFGDGVTLALWITNDPSMNDSYLHGGVEMVSEPIVGMDGMPL